MTKLLALAQLTPAALLLACSPQEPALSPPSTSAAVEAPASDGFDAPMDDFVPARIGRYELWQNLGDDGRMCEIGLTDQRTIGGYAVEADEACLDGINASGLFAWFIAPDDDYLVFIDATRQPLMRLKPDSNGVYFGNSDFYAIHQKAEP